MSPLMLKNNNKLPEYPRRCSFEKNRDPGFKVRSVKNHQTYEGSLKESLL